MNSIIYSILFLSFYHILLQTQDKTKWYFIQIKFDNFNIQKIFQLFLGLKIHYLVNCLKRLRINVFFLIENPRIPENFCTEVEYLCVLLCSMFGTEWIVVRQRCTVPLSR